MSKYKIELQDQNPNVCVYCGLQTVVKMVFFEKKHIANSIVCPRELCVMESNRERDAMMQEIFQSEVENGT